MPNFSLAFTHLGNVMSSCPALLVDCGSDVDSSEGQGDDDETFSCDDDPIAVN